MVPGVGVRGDGSSRIPPSVSSPPWAATKSRAGRAACPGLSGPGRAWDTGGPFLLRLLALEEQSPVPEPGSRAPRRLILLRAPGCAASAPKDQPRGQSAPGGGPLPWAHSSPSSAPRGCPPLAGPAWWGRAGPREDLPAHPLIRHKAHSRRHQRRPRRGQPFGAGSSGHEEESRAKTDRQGGTPPPPRARGPRGRTPPHGHIDPAAARTGARSRGPRSPSVAEPPSPWSPTCPLPRHHWAVTLPSPAQRRVAGAWATELGTSRSEVGAGGPGVGRWQALRS